MLYIGLMLYFCSIFVFQKFNLVLMNNDCFIILSKYNEVYKVKIKKKTINYKIHFIIVD